MMKKKKVIKTRNNGTLTESAYWSMIRSVLRSGTRYWKPIIKVKLEARRKYEGTNKRQKWEYQCNHCKEWFMDKQIQVDHIIPIGSLKCADDLKGFIERLTPETGFQVLCKQCHQIKTNKERNSNKKSKDNI